MCVFFCLFGFLSNTSDNGIPSADPDQQVLAKARVRKQWRSLSSSGGGAKTAVGIIIVRELSLTGNRYQSLGCGGNYYRFVVV